MDGRIEDGRIKDGRIGRRRFLQMLAGLLAAGGDFAVAADRRSLRQLIAAAQSRATLAERVALVSHALLGTRYDAHTLIGGPSRQEQFVVRDDAFDCVTYCETVLAAALARDFAEFETALRRLRYANDAVRWNERNHYFFDWGRRALDKGLCRSVDLAGTQLVEKSVSVGNVGRRQVAMPCAPVKALLDPGAPLATGDVIAFVSRRPNLDVFHTGFVIVGAPSLVLRHASQSRRRVLDEPMARFVTANRVQQVMLLRPQSPSARA